MYQIGDKVVYPVHGAGVVEAIESREIGGRNRQYYVLNLPYSSLRIMVPMEEAENVGLRSLMPTEAFDKVLQILEGRQEGKASPAVQAMKLEKWNNRFRMQMSSIKNGDVYELAEIVHSLEARNRLRPLSAGERKIFDQAREILFSELWLVSQACQPEIAQRIQQILDAPL